jgi:hypothetical protein
VPFLVITGTFHLVGRTPAGNPSGFEPDGDSVQFRPTDHSLLDGLTRVGRPYRLTSIGSTQLRFEGIDALESHFDGSHQPRPLADRARDFLTASSTSTRCPTKHPRRSGYGRRSSAMRCLGTSSRARARGERSAGRIHVPGSAPGSGRVGGVSPGRLAEAEPELPLTGPGPVVSASYDTLFADLLAVHAKAATTARQARRGTAAAPWLAV